MTYKITDAVAMRFIQIFQEAVLLGVDGADLMRQVRLSVDPENPDTLDLDADYKKFVEDSHQKYLKELEVKKSASSELNIDSSTFEKTPT